MAVTEIITLQTDASGAVTGIEQVTEEMKKLDTATTQTEEATKSLKTQIREMTNELLNMAEDDPRRQKLIEQLGEMKDRAADAADQVKGNTGPAFESMSNTFGIMTGQLANLDFDGLGKSLTQVGAAVGRVNFKSLMTELKGFAQGIGSLGKALLTNPIFLIGSVIAGAAVLISQNFDKIISYFPQIETALTGINKIDKEAAKNAQLRADASKRSYESITLEENALRLQGKSEREILNYRLAKLKTTIEDAKVSLETTRKNSELQMEAARKHAETIAKIVEITSFPILVLLDGVDQLRRVMGETSNLADDFKKGMTTYVFDVNQVEQSWTKNLGEMEQGIKQMESDYAGLQLQIRRMDQEAADKRKADKEKEKANEREAIDANLEFLKGKDLERLDTQREISLESINIKRVETKTINELDAELARLQEERLKKQRATRIQQAEEAFAVLADLNDTFISRDEKAAKKQFAVSKALNMAAAIMNTYGAINKALNDETMPSTTARIIQATIVGASGFANVAKIAKTQFSSTTSPGPSGGLNGGGNNMPTAPAVDFGFLQQTGQPNTVETYVLAGNVANALEARQKIIDQSYL
jgi:hypothetical protein